MLKRILSFEIAPVFGLLAICLLVGGLTVKDYGQSWDELLIYNYADHSIQSYQYLLHPAQLEPFPGHLKYYGPSYFMPAMITARLVNRVIPSFSHIDAIHFVFFLTLLACLLILYLLARRWMSTWAAFGTVLLFASQPMIWGHAFINPKDAPFMVFFLASIYLGLQMLDASGNSKWVWTIAAGIMLGLTISFRVIGPLAGVLVFLYGLLKFPRRLVPTFLFYVLIAGIVSYLTWPYLWKGPIAVLLESLQMMSDFPLNTPVLFFGDTYQPSELPRSYFPILLGLQLTEPSLFLIAAGLVISVVSFIKNKQREPLLLFAGWFLFPALWIIASDSPLYDNARQLLFLWPAMFLVAGLGIDWLISLLKSNRLKAALVLAIALPGIVACVRLHPYQYVYYNSLAGGVGGAYRNFELDYWVTSFKESMEYLNEHAEEGSTVVIYGHRLVARQYARPDLILVLPSKLDTSQVQSYYILSTTRANRDKLQCGDAAVIVFAVERDGGVLSYIEKISPDQPCK